ncbi:MAG TPA: galactose-1-phosphate uridylyltransferase, partial [Candidatus Sulfotelmatobacter sp.]|nr:galactose-1-phosphate uridylyltransferase [Candidatus Sulfotelmatobacter sp.]
HDLALGRMAPGAVRRIIDLWAEHSAELARTYRWVQVFENRGQAMGASSPHPHGQIWAGTALPVQASREDATQLRWCDRTRQRLLVAYAAQEQGGPRVVIENEHWLVVVPFWAAWPFETLVLPRLPVSRLPALGDAQRDSLAITLIDLLRRYDELFGVPFPYSMGWHQAPNGDGPAEHWQLHGHFYPPLLSSSMRKFMVGYELLAEVQRDLSAEDAAYRLRSV